MSKRLSQEVFEAIPDTAIGLAMGEARRIVGADSAHVRQAFSELDVAGAATMVKRGKGGALFVVLPHFKTLACAVCHWEYKRSHKSKRLTCSRACHASLGWRDPDKAAKRRQALKASQNTPKAALRISAHNKKRWSDPKQHDALAAQNRREWQDHEKSAIRSAKIRLKHQRPESRQFYSDLRKKAWADPVMRQKMHDAAAASQKTQAYREKMSAIAIARNKSPEFRAKVIARNKKTANDPTLKKRASERMKALWADPVWAAATRQKIAESRWP